MAITVDWGNRVINVPQNYLTPLGGGVYELDLDGLRLDLKDLEDDEEGMPFPDTHYHNTEVTLSGTTYARFLVFINNYTVTFEDGQYAVEAKGANTNLADVMNVNQVSLRSFNSAGLITVTQGSGMSQEEHDKLMGLDSETAVAVWDEPAGDHLTAGTTGLWLNLLRYRGGIYIDENASNTNTVVGTDGTKENPVSTIASARTIADAVGVREIHLMNRTSITLAQAYENFRFFGHGEYNQVDFGSQNVDGSYFHNMIITGEQGGSQICYLQDCWLTGLTELECFADACWLTGNNSIRAGNHIFDRCKSAVAGNATPEFTFETGTVNLSVRHYSGGLQVNDMDSGDTMSYESDGQLVIDASCSGGNISARGAMTITNNGAVNLTDDSALSNPTIADAVWADAVALSLLSDVDMIKQTETGKWEISGNQMIFYNDSLIEFMRFDLAYDGEGNPIMRTRV